MNTTNFFCRGTPLLIIAVLAIIGNFLVCLAITRNKKLRTVTNYFLVSLAVSDILVGLVAIPCAMLTDLGQLFVLLQSSILSLLAVAAERYMAILLPFQYQHVMSPRNAHLALLVTWGLGAISGTVPLMNWNRQPMKTNGREHWKAGRCGCGRYRQEVIYCIFPCMVDMSYMVYFNFFCCLLVPLAAMFIIYGHIFLTVRRQLRCISSVAKSNMRKELGKATFLFLVLFLFMVCWMPIHIINCVLLFCPRCEVPMSLIVAAILFSHANSALNPILYAYRMRSFRHTLTGITSDWEKLTSKTNTQYMDSILIKAFSNEYLI
uniref:G-protein coupled receptors family 1 profile domain-containing protein n=1 Tax=Monopterus albus TaxID=43700 RepID=A0A3Q3IK19_MONAL